MVFYFTDAQVPELAGLTKVQRGIVRRGAFDLFCEEQPSARWVAGLLGFGATFGFLLASGLLRPLCASHQMRIALVGGAVAGAIGAFIGAHCLMVWLRPYLRRYIEDNRNEILGAN